MRSTWNSLGMSPVFAGILLFGFGASAAAQMGAIPGGWHASRDSAASYTVGSDVSRRPGGTGFTSGYIRATVANPSSSAALTQEINADRFRGQRVRLTGFVRRAGDMGTALLFLRVEGRGSQLAADYTGAQVFVPSRTSNDGRGWVQQAIVVDIPSYSTGIRIGLVNMGADEAWLDDVKLEAVGATVALAGSLIGAPAELGSATALPRSVKRQEASYRRLSSDLVNLDFESAVRPR